MIAEYDKLKIKKDVGHKWYRKTLDDAVLLPNKHVYL